MSLFDIPKDLIRVFDRDLVAAGLARAEWRDGKWKIHKADEDERTLDIHCLRHTFGTYLSRAGVSPRTAQAAMRHSKLDLTMSIYTDPELLNVTEAVKAAGAEIVGGSSRGSIQ
ncbi:MAG: tyrosine-type recombinase/integrase [Phycisphaeraceae bacterium]|nr:tyrosine-type recombinase/integrase [Phycisphaeraceae bacterium]